MTIAEKIIQITVTEQKVYKSGCDRGYDKGKSEGYEVGKSEGYEDGKAEGYREGKTDGYEKGKTDGYNEGLLDGEKPEEVGYLDITKNCQFTYTPNEGQVFSSVEVNVNVPDTNGSYDEGYEEGKTDGYDAGFEAGKAEGGHVIPCSYTKAGYTMKQNLMIANKTLENCICTYAGHDSTIYGFAIKPDVKRVRLTGALLSHENAGASYFDCTFCLLPVKNYTIEGGGTCVQIMRPLMPVAPVTYEKVSPPDEFIIDIPEGLGVDGIYMSCLDGGIPVLENYPPTYDDGYADGYDDGLAKGNENVKDEIVGNFEITENREHTFTPDDGKVFSSVKVSVNVPTDSGGGDTETGVEVSTSFGPNLGVDKWICPPDSEGGETFSMMETDTSGLHTAFVNWSATPGKKYKVIVMPTNPNNLWETFVFGKNEYNSLAVISNDAMVGQYVTKQSEDTFIVTTPPECAVLIINGKIQYGCRVYEIE